MRRKQRLTFCFAMVCVTGATSAMFAPMGDEPVDRLVANITKYVMLHPKDANGCYTLGRVHSLAFSRAKDRVPARSEGNENDLPRVRDDGIPSPAPNPATKGASISISAQNEHLRLAIESFDQALRLDPHKSEHWMSLAYVLDRGRSHAMDVDALPGVDTKKVVPSIVEMKLQKALAELNDAAKHDAAMQTIRDAGNDGLLFAFKQRGAVDGVAKEGIKTILEDDWRERAIAAYLKAFQLSPHADMNRDILFGGVHTLTSHEAGRSYLQLVMVRGERDSDQKGIEEVRKGLKELEEKKWSEAITPIVLSTREWDGLDELVFSNVSVMFDLDGTGSGNRWTWVKPETGLLVWDPRATGVITSGRQLIGSASWWLLFENGYRALDALDDNRDGELSGDELKGLAVWFDRNSNGVSDPGEVIPVEQLGIVAIKTSATGLDGDSPCNREGLRMADGRVLPTYDWIARSVPESPESEPRPIVSLVLAATMTPLLFAARRRRPSA
jgi:hypothetical protein